MADAKTHRSLPFAEAPIGNLRWRAPVPIEKSFALPTTAKVIDATIPGVQCVQGYPAWQGFVPGVIGSGVDTDSEDCLHLDVLVPQNPVSKSLPVVVQIHGGGYTVGSSQVSYADGHNLVSYSKGRILYVQIQYRLGVYGFLGGSDVLQDGDANAGLLDQRLALNWVQSHITAFGGDPTRVTILGASAGGGSVADQLLLHGGEVNPPFRAAIPDLPWFQPYHRNDVLSSQYKTLLSVAGCHNLSCLRSLSFDALANSSAQVYTVAYGKGLYGYGDFYFGPYVDGKIIRGLPSDELKAGRWSKVPMLTDHESFEGLSFTNSSVSTAAEVTANVATLFQTADVGFLAALDWYYPTRDFTGSYFDQNFFSSPPFAALSAQGITTQNPYFWKLQELVGDYVINCPSFYLGLAASNSNIPVWKSLFNTGSCVHGSFVPYLLQDSRAVDNATLSNIVKDYYLSFVTDLDPNTATSTSGTTRPVWPRYQLDSSRSYPVLEFNTTSIAVREDRDAGARCRFWRSRNDISRN